MREGVDREKIKIILLGGLTVIFLLVGYFRFVPNKTVSPKGSERSGPFLPQVQVPDIGAIIGRKVDKLPPPAAEPHRIDIRDIFKPYASPPVEVATPRAKAAEKPAPVMKLKGIIYGHGESMAIINDQFVCKGDRVGEFRVLSIGKNSVRLGSGSRQIVLKMVENE
jgi:hypothetical protein